MGRGPRRRGAGRDRPKSGELITAADWAPYGVGEPDADGWYPDYRVPPDLKPAAPAQPVERRVFRGWFHIVTNWDAVVVDMAEHYRLDLWDPAVLARPWPGVRALIWSLLSRRSHVADRLEGSTPS